MTRLAAGRAAVLAAMLAVAAAVILMWTSLQQVSTGGIQRERGGLRITVINGEAGADAGVSQTVEQLKEAHGDVMEEWPPRPEAAHTQVLLHPGLEEYENATGLTGSAGYTLCRVQGPLVVMPILNTGWLTERSSRRHIQHEMVHAAICRSIGHEAYAELPAWFHEGEAAAWELRGISNLPLRVLSRLGILLNDRHIPGPREFCSRSGWENGWEKPGEMQAFYHAAREFTQHLKAQQGPKVLQRIAVDVKGGMTFEQSSLLRLGGTCRETYGEWRGR